MMENKCVVCLWVLLTLAWEPSIDFLRVDHYVVYRATSVDGPYVKVGTSQTELFVDDAPDGPLFYRVSSFSVEGLEGFQSYVLPYQSERDRRRP